MKTEEYYYAVLVPSGQLDCKTIRSKVKDAKEAFLEQRKVAPHQTWQSFFTIGCRIKEVCVIPYKKKKEPKNE